jgi:hypothetical protein
MVGPESSPSDSTGPKSPIPGGPAGVALTERLVFGGWSQQGREAMAALHMGQRRTQLSWFFVLVIVVGLMLLPYAAYGRGGPPDHAQGRPPLSPPVGPRLSPPVGPPLSPPVGPPLSPPIGPPDHAQGRPPLSPPVGPPDHVPVGPPDHVPVGPPDHARLGPPDHVPVGPPDHARLGPPRGRGPEIATVDIDDSVDTAQPPGRVRRGTKHKGRS